MSNIIKLLALGLSITFILSGCGSSGNSDNTNNPDNNTTITNKLTVKSVELK